MCIVCSLSTHELYGGMAGLDVRPQESVEGTNTKLCAMLEKVKSSILNLGECEKHIN